jgi:hypothetical protein
VAVTYPPVTPFVVKSILPLASKTKDKAEYELVVVKILASLSPTKLPALQFTNPPPLVLQTPLPFEIVKTEEAAIKSILSVCILILPPVKVPPVIVAPSILAPASRSPLK